MSVNPVTPSLHPEHSGYGVKKNPYFWLILILFIASRFLFLAKFPFFYDSPEYLRHAVAGNYFKTLATVHIPAHPVYLFLIQKFHQWFSFLPVSVSVSLVSAVFGLIGFLAFYSLVRRLFGNKIALLSLLPLIFFPHLWLIQTNVLHEAVEQGLFLAGLLVFDHFLEKKSLWLFIATLILWSLPIINFLGILIWFLAIIGLVYFRSTKKDLWKNLGWGIAVILISLLIGLLGLYFILSLAIKNPWLNFQETVFGYGGGGIINDLSFVNLLRILRNDFLILINGYSIFALPIVVLVLVRLYLEKRYREIILLLSFFIPFLITGKFWYGGLYGRYSVMVAYAFGLCFGLMLSQNAYWLMMAGLILSFIPTFLVYQQKPIALIEKTMIEKAWTNKKDLLILSDYQRPQLSLENTLYANGNLYDQGRLEEAMALAFSENRRVFISEQAVTFPYYQYDGQQLHIISRGDVKKSLFAYLLKNKKLIPVVSDENYPLLTIYEIGSFYR